MKRPTIAVAILLGVVGGVWISYRGGTSEGPIPRGPTHRLTSGRAEPHAAVSAGALVSGSPDLKTTSSSALKAPLLSPRALSEPPPDLPDWDQVGRDRQDLIDAWTRQREGILQGEAHLSDDRLAAAEERKARYLKAKAEFFEKLPPGTVTFSPSEWKEIGALSDAYERDMSSLIGSEYWIALKSARADLVQRFSRGGYTLPLDAY